MSNGTFIRIPVSICTFMTFDDILCLLIFRIWIKWNCLANVALLLNIRMSRFQSTLYEQFVSIWFACSTASRQYLFAVCGLYFEWIISRAFIFRFIIIDDILTMLEQRSIEGVLLFFCIFFFFFNNFAFVIWARSSVYQNSLTAPTVAKICGHFFFGNLIAPQ